MNPTSNLQNVCSQKLFLNPCCQTNGFKIVAIATGGLLLLATTFAIAGILLPNSTCPVLIHFPSKCVAALFITVAGVTGGGCVGAAAYAIYLGQQVNFPEPPKSLVADLKGFKPVVKANAVDDKKATDKAQKEYWKTEQNARFRNSNDDTHISDILKLKTGPARFFGVFDGHGGIEIADFVQKNIKSKLGKAFAKLENYDDVTVEKALKEAFIDVNEAAKKALPKAKGGSCGAVGIIIDGRLYIANVGDSRIIVSKKGKAFPQVSKDDNAKHEEARDELQNRAKKNGKEVIFIRNQVYGMLAVTKAFGDWGLNEYGVTAEPTVTSCTLEKGDFIIVACDGVWDVFTKNQTAVDFVGQPHKDPAAALVNAALDKGSTDNITVGILYV